MWIQAPLPGSVFRPARSRAERAKVCLFWHKAAFWLPCWMGSNFRHDADGKTKKSIAKILNMREGTVKVHIRNIMRKLNAANRTQAASIANRLFGQRAYPDWGL